MLLISNNTFTYNINVILDINIIDIKNQAYNYIFSLGNDGGISRHPRVYASHFGRIHPCCSVVMIVVAIQDRDGLKLVMKGGLAVARSLVEYMYR
jgi:hypothetical protein